MTQADEKTRERSLRAPRVVSSRPMGEGLPYRGVERPTFDTPHLPPVYNPNAVLDPYPQFDDAFIGGRLSGDVCPFCGYALRNTNDELRRIDGERGDLWSLAQDSVTIVVFHERCYRVRLSAKRGLVNAKLEDFE